MYLQKATHKKGYSLIELLVYIVLFTMLSIVIVRSLVTGMRTYATAQGYRRLQYSAETILDRLTREIRQAQSVSVSSPGTTSSTLTLTGTSAGVPYTTTVSASSPTNGVVTITTGGVASQLNNNQEVTAQLSFWRIPTTSSEAVRAQLVLTTTTGYAVTETFNTTVIVRQ